MKVLLIILCAVSGALISRWHGGGFGSGSKVLKNIIWSLPFGLCSFYALSLNTNIFTAIAVSALAWGLCLIGKASGHGGGMDLAHNSKEPGEGREPEKLEYLILWLHGKISQYKYDALLLVLCGLASVSGAMLVFSYVNPWFGAIIALGGALKALAYSIGWFLADKTLLDTNPKDFDEATEIGEFLSGFFAYGSLALTMVFL